MQKCTLPFALLDAICMAEVYLTLFNRAGIWPKEPSSCLANVGSIAVIGGLDGLSRPRLTLDNSS